MLITCQFDIAKLAPNYKKAQLCIEIEPFEIELFSIEQLFKTNNFFWFI